MVRVASSVRVCVARLCLLAVIVSAAFVGSPAAASAALPLSWSAPISLDTTGGTDLRGLACPSTGQCTTVDESGRQVTFNPTAPGTRTSTTIDDTQFLVVPGFPWVTRASKRRQRGGEGAALGP